MGFRLPGYGDPERGKIAFAALECNSCHEVAGSDLPKPTLQPKVPFLLGGEVAHEMTDGYLVTSIIHPSHQLKGYPKEMVANGTQSRMPVYADNMTVKQLTDIVAFLQSRYKVSRPLGEYRSSL